MIVSALACATSPAFGPPAQRATATAPRHSLPSACSMKRNDITLCFHPPALCSRGVELPRPLPSAVGTHHAHRTGALHAQPQRRCPTCSPPLSCHSTHHCPVTAPRRRTASSALAIPHDPPRFAAALQQSGAATPVDHAQHPQGHVQSAKKLKEKKRSTMDLLLLSGVSTLPL